MTPIKPLWYPTFLNYTWMEKAIAVSSMPLQRSISHHQEEASDGVNGLSKQYLRMQNTQEMSRC